MGTNGLGLFIGCVFGCRTVESSTVKVHADSMARLGVTANNSDITVSGHVRNSVNPNGAGVDLRNNNNTKLSVQLSGDLSYFFLDNNTFASPPQISVGNETVARNFFANVGVVSIERNNGLALGGITGLNTIVGDLIIANNSGFSDEAAQTFADARIVRGQVTIDNNRN
jgi:hypothetical protein